MDSRKAPNSRSPAIDLIKGVAIVSVICLHTLSPGTLLDVGAPFYLWQAVPVFLFLLGFNAASSLRRRRGRGLRELYTRDYLASRVDRVYVPFLVAFAGTMALAILAHQAHSSIRKVPVALLLGLFPIDGPGNYFVTLLFEFTAVFPLVFWGLRRWPVGTLLLCLALNTAFVVVAPNVGFFKAYPYLETTFFAGSLFLVALGGFCAGRPASLVLRSRWIWVGAPLSIAYLALKEYDTSALSATHLSRLAGPLMLGLYSACLALLGMALLPALARGFPVRGLAALGRASYHIFLVQIAWFGFAVWHAHSLPALLGNLAVTLTVGVAFYALMARVPLPSAARLLARRQAALADA